MGRPSLHRSQGQVAAPDHGRVGHRRGHAERRLHVRRLVDRGLEGDQRERHDPDARPRRHLCRSVQRDADADPVCDMVEPSTGELTPATPALPRRAPRPISRRPASATPSTSAPKPNSSCSTTSASRTAMQPASSTSTISNCRPTPAANMKAATWPPSARQGRLFPRRPGRQRRRHPRRDGLDHDRNGPAVRQAPPRGGRRASTSSA